jgi:hypothetical protein
MLLIMLIILLAVLFIIVGKLILSDNPEHAAHTLKAVSEQPLVPAQFQLSGKGAASVIGGDGKVKEEVWESCVKNVRM